jgi:hypothetical protein
MSYDSTYQTPEQLRRTSGTLNSIYVLSILIAIGGALLFASSYWGLYSFKTDLAANWTDVFTKYIFIILAIERAAAVWTGIKRNEKKREWDRRVKRVREILEKKYDDLKVPLLKQTYLRESNIIDEIERNQPADQNQRTFLGIKKPQPDTDKDELIAYLQMTKQVYEFKRAKYEEVSYGQITRIVFVGGIVISVLGLSLLGDILDTSSLDPDSKGYWWQTFFYRLADILITGGLLGGGSKGFSVFYNSIDSSLKRMQDPKGEN